MTWKPCSCLPISWISMQNIKPSFIYSNADPGRELASQRFRDFCIPVVGRVCFSVGNFPAVHTQYVSHFGGDLWLKVPTLLLKPTELPVFAVVGAGEAAAAEAFVVKV
ncbi:MAG: hypothetical protein GY845_05770 [Planctomycetes bacterium]|nr:hypothetical protein [Planctomycetota bacterium]